MTEQEIADKILYFKTLEDEGLEETDIQKLSAIIDGLIEIPKRSRVHFLSYVKDYQENLFRESLSVPGIEELKSHYNLKTDTLLVSKKSAKFSTKVTLDFTEALKRLIKAIPNLSTLKNNFIIELISSIESEFQCVVLYDENYFIYPFQKTVEQRVENVVFEKIEDASSYFEKAGEMNFICVLLLSPRINDESLNSKIKGQIEALIAPFETFNQITVRDYQNPAKHEKNTDKESFLEEFSFVIDQFLTNSDLDFDEEKAIKKLFEHYGFPILDYKILKGGKSGAKVVEITPKRKSADSQGKKYVVKISREKPKINIEVKRFKHNVADFGDLGTKYRMHNDSTTNMAGIMYEYASKSKHVKSYPLSEIIEDNQHTYHDKLESIINDIFEEQCFIGWKTEMKTEKKKVRDLYDEYIKIDKTFESIARIENCTVEEIMSSDFAKKFLSLLDKEMEVKMKICHGDLHSGNILIDEEIQEKYLIDFAFTAERHALIDHASLECSLKFNHLPRFVKGDDLQKIESEFLHEDSFYPTFQIKSTSRLDLKNTFKLVNIIRSDSVNYIQNKYSRLEYYVSLLMITFRQINYSDLNQLYAWESARVLTNHIDRTLIES